MRQILAAMLLGLSLAACSNDPSSAQQQKPSATAPVMPADSALASLYASTCMACHAAGIGDAPVAGDIAAWKPRMQKGMPTLIDNTINGFRGMPPLGSCSDCGEEDFRELIEFMASDPAATAGQESGS